MVGASGYPSGDVIGRVYVIYGGSSLTNINLANLTPSQGFTITGINNGDITGYDVSSAGDVNQDGYYDIVVGAYGYPSRDDVGRVYVIYGSLEGFATLPLSSQPSCQPSVIPTLLPTTSQPTKKPSTQPNYQPTSQPSLQPSDQPTGQPTSHPSLQPSTQPTDYPTVLPSSQPTSNPSMPSGQPSSRPSSQPSLQPASIPSSMPTSNPSFHPTKQPNIITFDLIDLVKNGFSITGKNSFDQLGYSLSKAGDVNGDGYDDVIIGAPRFFSYELGAAYIIYGNSNSFDFNISNIDSKGISIIAKESGDYSGSTVSDAGDVNGDGYDDVIIAAYDSGRAYIIFGGKNLSNIDLNNLDNKGIEIIGDGRFFVGYSEDSNGVSSAGDINGDGYDDVVIGCEYSGVYVIFGNRNLSNIYLSEINKFGILIWLHYTGQNKLRIMIKKGKVIKCPLIEKIHTH